VRVRFGDTDPYGIVYFVSYSRYCHRAIEEVLRVCGLKPQETFKNVQEGFGLPIVGAWGRFRRPAKYGELLRIETRIQEIRPKPLFSASSFILKPAGSSWRKAPPTWWPLTRPGGCGSCRNWSKVPYLTPLLDKGRGQSHFTFKSRMAKVLPRAATRLAPWR